MAAALRGAGGEEALLSCGRYDLRRSVQLITPSLSQLRSIYF
jgi:hypothetical protein